MACSWEYNGIYSQHNNYITNGNLGTLVFVRPNFHENGVQPTTRGNSSCMIGISRDMEVGQMGLYHLYTFIYYAQILLGAIYTLDTLKYT